MMVGQKSKEHLEDQRKNKTGSTLVNFDEYQ